MISAEYKHPNFTANQATKYVTIDNSEQSTMRLEYPDGVIVIFLLDAEGVTIQSNFDFELNLNTNVISPDLDSPNSDFKDIK